MKKFAIALLATIATSASAQMDYNSQYNMVISRSGSNGLWFSVIVSPERNCVPTYQLTTGQPTSQYTQESFVIEGRVDRRTHWVIDTYLDRRSDGVYIGWQNEVNEDQFIRAAPGQHSAL